MPCDPMLRPITTLWPDSECLNLRRVRTSPAAAANARAARTACQQRQQVGEGDGGGEGGRYKNKSKVISSEESH
jgi:hypothetical protein